MFFQEILNIIICFNCENIHLATCFFTVAFLTVRKHAKQIDDFEQETSKGVALVNRNQHIKEHSNIIGPYGSQV